MTIAAVFATLALIGLGIQSILLREAWLDEAARRVVGVNGGIKAASELHLRAAATRWLVMVFLTAAGFAAMIPKVHSAAGWLLVPLPVIVLVASALDYRARLNLGRYGRTTV